MATVLNILVVHMVRYTALPPHATPKKGLTLIQSSVQFPERCRPASRRPRTCRSQHGGCLTLPTPISKLVLGWMCAGLVVSIIGYVVLLDIHLKTNLFCYFKGHVWRGCRCQRCEKVRDLEHTYQGCICTQCHIANHSLKLESSDECCYWCRGSGYRDPWEGETGWVECEQCRGSGRGQRYNYRCQNCEFTKVVERPYPSEVTPYRYNL
jgi:hypothetical protein